MKKHLKNNYIIKHRSEQGTHSLKDNFGYHFKINLDVICIIIRVPHPLTLTVR